MIICSKSLCVWQKLLTESRLLTPECPYMFSKHLFFKALLFTHSVNTELSQHCFELSELIWQQVLFPHDLQSKRPQNEVKQKRLYVLNSQLSRLYASVLGSMSANCFTMRHNVSHSDISFLECNLTPANCFIMIRPMILFFRISSVHSLLHYLIDKTSHYFDTLGMSKSKCDSERENDRHAQSYMWSIWEMQCACSWSGASISLSRSLFIFFRFHLSCSDS